MDTQNVYIGLGSNLDNPRAQVSQAIDELKKVKEFYFVKTSSLYKSPPMGPPEQPDYINAVIKINCNLPAVAILNNLQELEQKHGRIREEKWGARSLDLDILLYGDQEIETNRLNIPHPGLYVRAFVLYPLLEIEPNFILPNDVALDKHIKSLGKHEIVKLI